MLQASPAQVSALSAVQPALSAPPRLDLDA